MQQTLDPFAAIERIAKRKRLGDESAHAMSKARVQLVLGKDAQAAFFATLALRLKPVANWDIDTACTDGKMLEYNPEFLLSLSPQQRVGLLVHEVMHIAYGHAWRRGGREPKRFNVSADLAINGPIRDAKFSLPPGALFPGSGQFRDLPPNLSAEEYYNRLPTKQPQGEGGGDDPGKCGGVKDAGDPAEQQNAESDWRVAVAQAAQAAKGRGELPGGLARLVDEIVDPKVAWEQVLAEFLTRSLSARDDYSWSYPNRRYIAQGIYLPSLKSDSVGDIVIAVDTSGSIGADDLKLFGGELNGILELHPCRVSVVYCDADIQHVQEWEPADGPLVLEAKGGGGTSHCPVWDWLKKQEDEPACVVCLTDGYTNFGADPGVPVLWAIKPDGMDADAPFGRTIHMEA